MKKFHLSFLIIGVLTFTQFNLAHWSNKKIIDWDVISYYAYLPATFVEHDLALSFYSEKPNFYINNRMYWPASLDNGAHVIKTSMGLSILYAPFFVIGQLEAYLTGGELNGFDVANHKWVSLSALFYLFFGIYFLHQVLSKHFGKSTSTITILAIIFGTNALFYATTKAAMSHIYTFSILAGLIYVYDRWKSEVTMKKTIALGLLSGMIILIRPTNLLLLLWLPFYQATSVKSFINNLEFLFLKHWKQLLLIIVISFMIVFPQLIYWKTLTGHWVFNSYVGERFFFNHPHTFKFLFGFRKGWFLYTPLMLVAVMGYFFLYKQNKGLILGGLIPLTILIFMYSCWWAWWFGGSFGSRPMVDLYPLLAFPLAALIAFTRKKSLKFVQIPTFALLLAIVGLNIFQTTQYRNSFIHHDSMTKEAYFEHFLARHYSSDFPKLIRKPDYKGALATGVENEELEVQTEE